MTEVRSIFVKGITRLHKYQISDYENQNFHAQCAHKKFYEEEQIANRTKDCVTANDTKFQTCKNNRRSTDLLALFARQ